MTTRVELVNTYESLTAAALADHLRFIADRPMSSSADEKWALLYVAADRLDSLMWKRPV